MKTTPSLPMMNKAIRDAIGVLFFGVRVVPEQRLRVFAEQFLEPALGLDFASGLLALDSMPNAH